MSSENDTTPTEVLVQPKREPRDYNALKQRAFATRKHAQETVSGLLTAIEAEDRSSWFSRKFHQSLDAAQKLDRPDVVLNGLSKFVSWLNDAEKAGERSLDRLNGEELQERRELLIAHLKKENPEMLEALVKGAIETTTPEEDAGCPVPDAIDTTATEGC